MFPAIGATTGITPFPTDRVFLSLNQGHVSGKEYPETSNSGQPVYRDCNFSAGKSKNQITGSGCPRPGFELWEPFHDSFI
jgi:hypothetical protein